ncbi:MAG: ComEC/Rec2 family competence protein [Bryobacteraceae bacterium]
MRAYGAVFLMIAAASAFAARPLRVYFVDVEGGQATLVVSPSGQSMLVDTGWPGHNGRDAGRIVAAARKAGVKRLDYVVVTHYDTDHVGGVPNLAERIPIGTFIDHGASAGSGKQHDELVRAYAAYRDKTRHIEAKPGDTIPLKDVKIQIVTSAGNLIPGPLPGAGEENPACAGLQPRPGDGSENAQSIGMFITFGKFRMLDLADVTWNKELQLMCPRTVLPPVDVYVVSHHGMNMSGSAALVHPLRARAAIMNNGARKGGTPEAWQVIRKAPGLEDIWQLHYTVTAGRENNAPDTFIANTDEQCEGQGISLTAEQDGTFTITNARNKYTKTYKPRS